MHLERAGHVLLYRTIHALADGLKAVTIHFGMCVCNPNKSRAWRLHPVVWLFSFWFSLLIGPSKLIPIVHKYLVRHTSWMYLLQNPAIFRQSRPQFTQFTSFTWNVLDMLAIMQDKSINLGLKMLSLEAHFTIHFTQHDQECGARLAALQRKSYKISTQLLQETNPEMIKKNSLAALQKRDKDNNQSKQHYFSITKIVKIYTVYESHDFVHTQIFTVTSFICFQYLFT